MEFRIRSFLLPVYFTLVRGWKRRIYLPPVKDNQIFLAFERFFPRFLNCVNNCYRSVKSSKALKQIKKINNTHTHKSCRQAHMSESGKVKKKKETLSHYCCKKFIYLRDSAVSRCLPTAGKNICSPLTAPLKWGTVGQKEGQRFCFFQLATAGLWCDGPGSWNCWTLK